VAAPDSVFVNDAILTTRTNIDAPDFINGGYIIFDTISSGGVDGALFQTQDTLNYTNTGFMLIQPGMIFDYHSASKGDQAAASFSDTGTIISLDSPPVAFWAGGGSPIIKALSQPPGTGAAELEIGGTAPYLINSGGGTNLPVPSATLVSASNILVRGTMLTGDLGDLQFNGANINLSGGTLGAGSVSETDTNATAGRGLVMGYSVGGAIDGFYSPPPVTYDICWTLDNGSSYLDDVDYVYDSLYYLTEGLDEIITPGFPVIGVNTAGTEQGGTRNGTLEGYSLLNSGFDPESIFPIGSPVLATTASTTAVTPVWSSFVYYYEIETESGNNIITNWYYNIMYVNTAFADADITAQVAFYGESLLGIENEPLYGGINTVTNGSPYALEGMIRFSAPVTDVLTGQIESNSIYFLDTSGIQVPAFYATNTIYASAKDARPLGFEITRIEPAEWAYQIPGNELLFDPTVLITYIRSNTVAMTNSFYVAQVGRNPEAPDGLDSYTAALLGHTQTGLPDITNEPGRIEINSSKTLVVSNMTMRANGFVTINATNLTGTPAAVDFGNYNVYLGNLKNPLLISNLFPAAFKRLRGDVAAYSADWMNVITNDGITTNRITNNVFYHVLIVDQDLRDSFQSTGVNVALRGNNVVVDDPMRVMGSVLFQTTNLTLNSNLSLTGAAGTLQTANVPMLQNLLIGPGGSVVADNHINLGVVPSASPANPTKLNTPILSITNLGQIQSGETEFQARVFAEGGGIVSSNGGSIVINAITNYLGAGGLGRANTLSADGDINLTSTSIQITNSTLLAGQGGVGQLVLYAPGELTDHHPNTASTKRYTTNLWQVTDGFSLPVKPASGDLFGTQIKTIAANEGQTIDHVWAGQDLGPAVAGFFNNEVIGHLILDRTAADATLEFSAAGRKNAMYVDYLEFQDLAFSDYHHGLVVDPNFTIYFANANVDPDKLQKVYSNIVWVSQFAGPNSTTKVEYLGGSNCLMNTALASSSTISSDYSGIVNLENPHPLNNPTAGPIPCPSQVTSTEVLSVTNGVSGQTFVIWSTGQGIITPSLSQNNVKAGQSISLTAVPASGWLFLGWSGAVVSSQPSLTFAIPASKSFSFLTANFITNPFIALAGEYNGLFYVSTNVAGNNSGSVTFTLNNQGVFSGKLIFGTTNYPFSSQFNMAQSATASATNGSNILAVALQVGQSGLTGEATGSVSNGAFHAGLKAYQAPAWTAAQPAPQAGNYTLVLPGNANAAASPGGDSYGTATVDALGNLTAIGTLADGVSFSQAVPLSKGGLWALYIAPAGVPQPLLGWVGFDTNGAGGTSTALSGTVTWVRDAGPGTFYTNGFTNTSILLGSIYSAAFQKTNGLALRNPAITLSGGNLAGTVTEPVSVSGLETYQSADKSLTLTINAATGVFNGQYVPPGTSQKVPLAGVVLQKEGVARGYFPGTNQTGAVLLQGN
jgi:hypothetical protein